MATTTQPQQQLSRPVWNAETLPPPMILNLEDSMVVTWRLLAECEFVSQVVLTLVDPISSARLKQPSRSFYCKHAQCFEYKSFITTNRNKVLSEYQCPICLAPSNPSKVYCDSLWLYILHEFPAANEVILNRAGIAQSYQNEGNHHDRDNVIDLTGSDDEDEPLINGSTHSSSAKIVDIKGLARRNGVLHQLVQSSDLRQSLELTDFKKLSSTNMWDLLHLVNSKEPLEEIISTISRSENRLVKYFKKLPEGKPYVSSAIDFLAADLKYKLKVSFKDAKLMIEKVAHRQKVILSEISLSFLRYRDETNAHWNSTSLQPTNDSLNPPAPFTLPAAPDSSAQINMTSTTKVRSIPAAVAQRQPMMMKNEMVANNDNSSSIQQANAIIPVNASSSCSSGNSTSSSSCMNPAPQLPFQQNDFSSYLQIPYRVAPTPNQPIVQHHPANIIHATINDNPDQLSNISSSLVSSSSSTQLNRSIPHIRQFHGTAAAAIAALNPPYLSNIHVLSEPMMLAQPESTRQSAITQTNHGPIPNSSFLNAPFAAPLTLQEFLPLPSSSGLNSAPPSILPMVSAMNNSEAPPPILDSNMTPSFSRQRSHLQMEESDNLQVDLNESGVSLSRPSLSRRNSVSISKAPQAPGVAVSLPSQAQSVVSSSVPNISSQLLSSFTAVALPLTVNPVNNRPRADSIDSRSSDLKSISSIGNQTEEEIHKSIQMTNPAIAITRPEDTVVTSPLFEGQYQKNSSSQQQPPAPNAEEHQMEEDDDTLDSESDSSSIVFLDFARAERPSAEVLTAILKTEATVATEVTSNNAGGSEAAATYTETVPAVQPSSYVYQPADLQSRTSPPSAGSKRSFIESNDLINQNNKRKADAMEFSSSSSSLPPAKVSRTEQQQQPVANGFVHPPPRQQANRQERTTPIYYQPRPGAPRHPPLPSSQHQHSSNSNNNNNVYNNVGFRAQSNSQSLQYGSVLHQQRGGHRGPGRLKLFAPPRAEPMPNFADDDQTSTASSQPIQAQSSRPIYVQRQRQTPPKPPGAQPAQPSAEDGPRTAHVRLMVNDFSE